MGNRKTYKETMLREAIVKFHQGISPFNLVRWYTNVRSTLGFLAPRGLLTCGSGCSCTDCYVLAEQALFEYWAEVYKFKVPKHQLKMAAEKDPASRSFLMRQHPELEMLLKNVQDFYRSMVVDVLSGTKKPLPDVKHFTAGFVCTSITSESSCAA